VDEQARVAYLDVFLQRVAADTEATAAVTSARVSEETRVHGEPVYLVTGTYARAEKNVVWEVFVTHQWLRDLDKISACMESVVQDCEGYSKRTKP